MGYEGDTCSFTCNTGYELTGSDTRICQSNGNWSGSDDVCRRGTYILNYIVCCLDMAQEQHVQMVSICTLLLQLDTYVLYAYSYTLSFKTNVI